MHYHQKRGFSHNVTSNGTILVGYKYNYCKSKHHSYSLSVVGILLKDTQNTTTVSLTCASCTDTSG